MSIRLPELCAFALLAISACAESHGPACAGEDSSPADSEMTRCAPRAADEWADGPLDARSILVPESAHVGPTGRYADLIVLTGDPSEELAARRTFRLGLSDGTLTPTGYESITGAWLRSHLERIEAETGLDRLLVCVPLPAGRELRLLPSRPSAASPDPAEFYSPAFGRAARIRDARGEVAAFPLWAPDESTEEGRHCGSLLVWTRERRYVQCLTLEPMTACAWDCAGLTRESTWQCTGRAPDGLAYCVPP